MFVESCERFEMGQSVAMCFSLANDSLALKLNGRVVRIEHGGIGIEFESLTGYQQEIMKDLINQVSRQISVKFRTR